MKDDISEKNQLSTMNQILLKTNAIGKPVEFFTGELKQGDPVEALGHPRRLKFSLTKGWVSGVRKSSSVYSATDSENVLFVQTDAAINPGNSGGPLFFNDKVIGEATTNKIITHLKKDDVQGK